MKNNIIIPLPCVRWGRLSPRSVGHSHWAPFAPCSGLVREILKIKGMSLRRLAAVVRMPVPRLTRLLRGRVASIEEMMTIAVARRHLYGTGMYSFAWSHNGMVSCAAKVARHLSSVAECTAVARQVLSYPRRGCPRVLVRTPDSYVVSVRGDDGLDPSAVAKIISAISDHSSAYGRCFARGRSDRDDGLATPFLPSDLAFSSADCWRGYRAGRQNN